MTELEAIREEVAKVDADIAEIQELIDGRKSVKELKKDIGVLRARRKVLEGAFVKHGLGQAVLAADAPGEGESDG